MTKTNHDSETPAAGQQVITACGFIHRKFNRTNKVFLAKRAASKKFLPGVFELPGGHIDFGEDIVEGLKREIAEEFEARIEVGQPFFVFTYTNDVKGSHSIEVIYLAQFTSDINQLKINPADHSEVGWFGENQLSKIYSTAKDENDPEIRAIKQGFKLLADRS